MRVSLLLFCLAGLLRQFDAAVMIALKWSKSYTFKAEMVIPSANFTVPYQVWNNGETQRSRMDFYGGVNKIYRQWNELSNSFDYFKIHLNTTADREVCHEIPSTAAEMMMYALNVFLPVKPWKYLGPEKIHNIAAQKFIYKRLINEMINAEEIYTVWVTFKNEKPAVVPLRFVYEIKHGNRELVKYRHDYLHFDSKKPDVQTLLIPLGMQCNPLANISSIQEPMDFLPKHWILDSLEKFKKSPEFQWSSTFSDANGDSLQWSKSYTLKAVLTVPAANITEPYQVWLDGDTGKARVDFYNGMDKLFREFDDKNKKYIFYKIFPVTNSNLGSKRVCNEVAATEPEVKVYVLNTYLPIKRWTYVGNEYLNNIESKKFVYEYPVKIHQKDTGKVVYTVWVNFKGSVAIPIRFDYQLQSESKILDNFRHDYTYFDASKPDASVLEKPSNIKCKVFSVESFNEPIDPLVEYIEPKEEYSRVMKAFDRFKTKHNKIYTNEDEHFKRMNIFKDNLRFINSFNRQHRSFTVGINKLADLSKEEIKVFLGTINKNNDIEREGSGDFDDFDDYNDNNNNIDNAIDGSHDKKHTRFDWRDYGAVTPVKDQTSICGGCYAFTTAAAVESSAYVAKGCKNLQEVSEQAIIDCTWWVTSQGNFGCSGGLYENALIWVVDYGIPLKSEYGPYLAMEGRCHAKEMNKLIRISSYYKLKKKSQVIKSTLRENGPLLASLDTKPLTFTFYTGGVYDESECSNDPKDRSHGVTIVGYGREQGVEYWTIKNSYGKDWGEDGYMRIAQARNRCGLKNDVYALNFAVNKSSNCTLPS